MERSETEPADWKDGGGNLHIGWIPFSCSLPSSIPALLIDPWLWKFRGVLPGCRGEEIITRKRKLTEIEWGEDCVTLLLVAERRRGNLPGSRWIKQSLLKKFHGQQTASSVPSPEFAPWRGRNASAPSREDHHHHTPYSQTLLPSFSFSSLSSSARWISRWWTGTVDRNTKTQRFAKCWSPELLHYLRIILNEVAGLTNKLPVCSTCNHTCKAFLYGVPGKFKGADTTPFMKVTYSFLSCSASGSPGSRLMICFAIILKVNCEIRRNNQLQNSQKYKFGKSKKISLPSLLHLEQRRHNSPPRSL